MVHTIYSNNARKVTKRSSIQQYKREKKKSFSNKIQNWMVCESGFYLENSVA